MPALAVYPGSFDPLTWGHLSLVEQGLAVFDRLVVAVARNAAKAALFSVEERLAILRAALAAYEPGRVEADCFEGLSADYARRRGAVALLRGLRGPSDFEYEFQMAQFNRSLAPDLQTVYLTTDGSRLFISSSLAKEAAAHGAGLQDLVPPAAAQALEAKFRKA